MQIRAFKKSLSSWRHRKAQHDKDPEASRDRCSVSSLKWTSALPKGSLSFAPGERSGLFPTYCRELAGDAASSVTPSWSNCPCQEAEPTQLGTNWTLPLLGASLAAQPGTQLAAYLGEGKSQPRRWQRPGHLQRDRNSPRGHPALHAWGQTHCILL